MNIFVSKGGHLSNRIIQRFSSFFPNFLQYLMIFQNGECQMCCRTRKNHQILQQFGGNEENHAMVTIILMAAFGTKNVHSGVGAFFLTKNKNGKNIFE